MKKAIVIGGGVHGLSSSIALAKEGLEVSLFEKEKEMMTRTSMGTQYRGHLGYHYPRSPETVAECYEGLEFFKSKYPKALFYPEENYYLIAKNGSKTSYSEYKQFCETVGLPYVEELYKPNFWNKWEIDGGLKVPEPVYNPKLLREILQKEASNYGIKIHKQSKLIGFEEKNKRYNIISSEGDSGKNNRYEADIIINTTYAYTNNILKILGLEAEMTKYFLQNTEVVIARRAKKIPALTVMDGPFISLLPIMGEKDTDLYVVYDVVNSVLNKEEGYFLDDTKQHPSNWNKMVEHGKKYFPFFEELEYVESLYGSRPIPVKITGDSRQTRIKTHQKYPGIYSLLEGKFISAPLMAKKLIEKIKEEGII